MARAFKRLYRIICRLRAPGGCAWDRQQTAYSLRGNLLEEALESISAIEERNAENTKEELGDLYLVISMMVRICEEGSLFRMVDVLDGITQKIIRRHPHVFGSRREMSVPGILAQWEDIKSREPGKERFSSALDGVPSGNPPLEKAFELQKAAAKVGFDWENAASVWDKLEEETAEAREAVEKGDAEQVEKELGDVLFTVVNLVRILRVNPSLALRRSNEKFARRFREMERRMAAAGRALQEAGLEEMDAHWEAVKRAEGREK